MKQIKVNTDQAKLRLDKYLTEQLSKSRSQNKKDIENGLVFVNNQQAKVHQFLNKNDIIDIKDPEPVEKTQAEEIVEDKRKSIKEKIQDVFSKKSTENAPKIITKEKNFIIIEKPAGLLVHPTLKNEPHTLINWLIAKFPE